MAKVLSDRIKNRTPIWTVDPLLLRQDNVGVEAYSSEVGVEEEEEEKTIRGGGRLMLLLVCAFVLIAVLVAAVLYLAVAEFRTTWREETETIEEGVSLVEGHLRITNRVFTKDLLDPHSEAYGKLALQITHSMDAVFLRSLQNYNETRVLSYGEGSVIARLHIHLLRGSWDAAHQVGLSVVTALERHHGFLPGGLLQVDIRSLHFSGSQGIVPEKDLPAYTPTEVKVEGCQGGKCDGGQVCLIIPPSTSPRCMVHRELDNPCGGWCDSQLCRRLGNATFQCTECGAGEFICGDPPCLSTARRCDGRLDCSDGRDELNCTKASVCGVDQFTCSDGGCVPSSLFCDRLPDCGDGSDEPAGCGEACLGIPCANGRCVAGDRACDGRDDCGDGTDEQGCSVRGMALF